MEIRPLEPGDLEAVMRLWLDGNREAHPFVPAGYWEGRAAEVREAIARAEVLVCADGGAVRDYLRAFPEAARRYGALKTALALRFPWDIEAYCDGKDAFVHELEREALAWRAAAGEKGLQNPGNGL